MSEQLKESPAQQIRIAPLAKEKPSRGYGRPPSSVTVVIGVGGMGEVIARKQGAGKTLLLADYSQIALERTARALGDEGMDVMTQVVDVSDRASVKALAQRAAELGPVGEVVHTAGVSPTQAPIQAILNIDLLGVAIVLEEFGKVVAPGGAGVIIASMAAYVYDFPREMLAGLSCTPVDELLALPAVANVSEAAQAYGLSKRANQLRVQSASREWAQRGARINSVSPGIISTPMAQKEFSGPTGENMRANVVDSPVGRIGTPSDIAEAVAFLLGPNASFITGTDLLVDGGSIATWGGSSA